MMKNALLILCAYVPHGGHRGDDVAERGGVLRGGERNVILARRRAARRERRQRFRGLGGERGDDVREVLGVRRELRGAGLGETLDDSDLRDQRIRREARDVRHPLAGVEFRLEKKRVFVVKRASRAGTLRLLGPLARERGGLPRRPERLRRRARRRVPRRRAVLLARLRHLLQRLRQGKQVLARVGHSLLRVRAERRQVAAGVAAGVAPRRPTRVPGKLAERARRERLQRERVCRVRERASLQTRERKGVGRRGGVGQKTAKRARLVGVRRCRRRRRRHRVGVSRDRVVPSVRRRYEGQRFV
mmetsp:Transcript_8594/g.36385  ORF Transcript_8594/g.36385 Transcript_8594/m.36385 type:complete len:302 (-) Transcript_8594:378-1283(-)